MARSGGKSKLSNQETEDRILNEQEAIQKYFSDHSNAGLIRIKNKHIVYANKKIGEMLGYDPKELCEKTFISICPQSQPNGRPSARIIGDAIFSSITSRIEVSNWCLKSKNDDLVKCDLFFNAVIVNNVLFVQVEVYETISKQVAAKKLRQKNKEIELLSEERESLNEQLRATLDELVEVNKQLIDSESWNKSIVDNIPLGMMVLHKKEVEYVNDKLADILEYQINEIKDMSFIDFAIENEKEKIKKFNKKFNKSQSASSLEFWIHTKTGKSKFIRNLYVRLSKENRTMIITTDLTDEKIKEIEITAARERLEFAIEANQSVIWDIDLSVGSSRYGDNFGRLFGYEAGELKIDKNLWKELTHPDDMPMVMNEMQKHMDGEVPFYEAECRIITKSGEWKWVLTRGKVFNIDNNQHPSRFIGMFIDISKRKSMEGALKDSENRYRAVITNTPVVFFSINADEVFTLLEGKGLSKLELNPEHALGNNIAHIFKEYPAFTKAVKKALLGNTFSEIMNLDHMVFETHMSPVYDDKGRAKAVVGVMNDITDKQLAEENLKFSEEKFSKAFNTSIDSIVITSYPEGRIVDVNQGFLINTNLERNDVINKKASDLHFGPDTPNDIEKLEQVLKQKSKIENLEIYWKNSKGETRDCLFSAEFIEIKDRKYIINTIHDITEARWTEEKLKRSEEKFKTIVQHLSDIILIVDEKMIVKYESPSVSRIFGYEPGYLVDKSGLDFIHPEDVSLVRYEFENVIRGNNDFYPSEIRVKHKSGNWIFLDIIGDNLLNHPAIEGIILTARDITERKENMVQLTMYRDHLEQLVLKRTEEIERINSELIATNEKLKFTNQELAKKNNTLNEEIIKRIETQLMLEESENKFRSFIEQSTEGITLIDESGQIVDWNKGMESIFRINREEVINTYVWEFDYRFLPEKRKSPEQFEELKTSVMNYLADIDHTKVMTVEGLYMTMELKQKYLYVTIFPVITPKRKYVGRIFRDVTGIRRAQEEIQKQSEELKAINENLELQKEQLENALLELKKAQAQLIQSEKMASLGVLTAGVAHEINNPVNFINTALEGLKITLSDLMIIFNKYQEINSDNIDLKLDEIEKLKIRLDYPMLHEGITLLVSNMQTGIERITEIVSSLRTFARVEENELKMSNIHELLDTTLVMLHNQTKNKINIVKDYGKIPLVNCFPGKLSQVFMNILSNAIQAIPGKGQISITTKKDPDSQFLLISFVDDGTGIPDHIKDKIFEPFFTTKEAGKGTGLGLTISYGIIKQHSGNIDVISKKGKGTEFIVSIPLNLE
jgi:PAS domain S-box-containing protein